MEDTFFAGKTERIGQEDSRHFCDSSKSVRSARRAETSRRRMETVELKSLRQAWRVHRNGATIFAETTLGVLSCENGTIRILSPNAALVVSFDSTFSSNYKRHFFYRLRDARNMVTIGD